MKTPPPTTGQPEFDRYVEDYNTALARGLSASGETREYFAAKRVEWVATCLGERFRVVPMLLPSLRQPWAFGSPIHCSVRRGGERGGRGLDA